MPLKYVKWEAKVDTNLDDQRNAKRELEATTQKYATDGNGQLEWLEQQLAPMSAFQLKLNQSVSFFILFFYSASLIRYK